MQLGHLGWLLCDLVLLMPQLATVPTLRQNLFIYLLIPVGHRLHFEV